MTANPTIHHAVELNKGRYALFLLVGFSFVFILMLIPIVIGLQGMSKMQENIDTITLMHNEKKRLLNIMENGIRKRQVSLREMILYEDPFFLDELRIQFMSYAGEVAQARTELEAMTTEPQEVEIFTKLVNAIRYAYPIQNELADSIYINENIKSIRKNLSHVFESQQTVLNYIERLNKLQEAGSKLAVTDAKQRASKSYRTVLSITFVSLMLGLLLAFYVTRKIFSQQKTLEHSMHALELSHTSLEKRVKERTHDLERARDTALAAERSMSSFLSNMSHEIRTPIHGILSFASFGIKKSDSATRGKLLQFYTEISDSAKQLLKLVNDLLDLSKLRAGKMSYHYHENNICSAISSVVKELSLLINEKQIITDISCDCTENFVFDNSRITQVIRNLLSNAIKFSQTATTITISVNKIDDMIEFTIKDQGIGIPGDELEIIFDAFSQSSVTKSKAGGTGLGLPICKEIIEHGHKGKIYAQANADRGACFIFTVPDYLPDSSSLL